MMDQKTELLALIHRLVAKLENLPGGSMGTALMVDLALTEIHRRRRSVDIPPMQFGQRAAGDSSDRDREEETRGAPGGVSAQAPSSHDQQRTHRSGAGG